MPAKVKSAADYLPASMNLAALRNAAVHCEGCELYKRATQVVFGKGPRRARVMLVGEIPGDQEDLAGVPFVGPAGRLLDESLHEATLDRGTVYMTNAVKHFKWEERGKRRLHKKPTRREVVACRAWLEAEIFVVAPRVIVCLGATAAQSLLGPSFRITAHRGEPQLSAWAPWLVPTYHPSAILRAPDREARDEMRSALTQDLATAARLAAESK